MKEELSALTNQALLEKAKKMKSTAIMNATLIGFMIGVVIYGVVKNGWGLLTLIPLLLLFKVFHNPKEKEQNEALKKLLKERGLE